MGLIIQQRALQAAGGLREVLPVVRKRDRSLFDQMHRAMNSVVLNIAEADGNDAGTARARFASACGSAKEVRVGLQLAIAYGYVPSSNVTKVDTALDEVCAMSWRLSGR
ncbi:MAG: four helix bundle protein [Deltaproteobacteria bacterium]|nr:four helix bundle protein [Deltaproteobacteria bacterium]NND29182.1 four helix bundle protein [Myxococcales bacterium]NNK08837.1 four helix bundle protein [Myxococcales bacterium]NNK41979.1 four helix bundle protein [Myxococcales bacterium]